MKHFEKVIMILFVALASISCGNESKKATNEIEKTTQTIKNATNVATEASAMNDNIQQLRKEEHLNKEEWQSWLPETILDMPLSTSQINFIPGLGSCAATYKIGNKRIRVMVIDGAGEKGAGGVGPYRMSSKMNYDEDGAYGYTKTRVIEGVKVKESYSKSGKSYNLSMFYAERFAVDVETHELEQNSLDQIVQELNLNELKKILIK